MRKSLLSLVAVLLLSVALGACGGGEKSTPTAKTPGASPAAGPVDIDLWHSEQAANQDTINRLADRFNASQNEVRVHPSFQGTYEDAMAKVVASLPTGDVPAVALLGDIYTQMAIDSGGAVPIQDFVDRDGYDLSDLDPKGVQAFTSQDKLWAMPFAVDVVLLYYNKVALREVGLDPERPPRDLEEVRQYSEKLLKRDGSGNVTRSGLALDIAAWTERMLADHGDLLVDQSNGHDGRATKVLFDDETSRWFFQWWHDTVESGLVFNVGRNPTMAEGLLAIASGRAAMTLSYSGALRSVIDVLEAGDPGAKGIEVGVGQMPGVPGSTGQTGAFSFGLWIFSARPKEEQEAAWEFTKWLMEPEQQAEWFAGSGYLPGSRSAVDLPAAQDVLSRYPLFQVAFDLYLDAPATPATVGTIVGPYQKVREAIYRGVEEMLSGVKDPDQALADAAANANQAIAEYNQRVED
jgi:sn-glycerol 3-phosphate transport system substrate-binding protein